MQPKTTEQKTAYAKRAVAEGGVVCLSGAGLSADSGIPTFRGKGGLWERYDPEVYGNAEGLAQEFRRAPQRLAEFLADFYSLLTRARPNPGHRALAALEQAGLLEAVITQNIDNLHQQSGSRRVIELHGNAFRIRCPGCARAITIEKERMEEMCTLLGAAGGSATRILRVLGRYFPRCACRQRFRVDIVLFGEMLPAGELEAARSCLESCKTLLVVGTSLAVYPAASLPSLAKERGARLIEINSQPNGPQGLFDCRLEGPSSAILQQLVRELSS